MNSDYEVNRKSLFSEFGWEDNEFTNLLFCKAYEDGHAYGWGEVKSHMSDMDDIYIAAKRHYPTKHNIK